MTHVLVAALFVAGPVLVLVLTRHVPVARALGPIVLCYAAGLVAGLSGLLPGQADAARVSVMEASLALALPLLLFSVDVRAWRRVAGRAMLSMLLAVVAVVFVGTVLFWLFAARGVDRPEQLTAMAVGMYTGGIANMGAIKLALGIPDARYLLFATVDTVVGAGYLLFVLTAAPRLFARFLPPFPGGRTDEAEDEVTETHAQLFGRAMLGQGAVALVAAAVCVGLAVGLAPMVQIGSPQVMVIVLLTTFGLLASLVPALRRNRAAPRLGMYLIYVFSLAVAASMDLTALRGMEPTILVFVAVATFGSLLLHGVLSRIAGIDVDTFLITSVAAIMSPAFVPMVARSLRNPAILMSGMATGILGFAIGNYLGISVALFLTSGG
ncbi:DUF819 family protein [Jhaorihella thermophila]|uniref:Uncharacterized membrane protein n=1 Tax=Jhaorihella thermophila TaxID=488547 RepID=A0A1H5VKA8_9RHOB|nr:DUF819 family protein [Jhaorihella thermophila]SEF87684.1 Uncharacterized membrane protein [Jhaorihella thermophila]